MDATEAAALLTSLTSGDESRRVWIEDGTAHARIQSGRADARYAVVSSSGQGWFEVAVNDGFGFHFYDQDADDDAAAHMLTKLVAIGRRYVALGGEPAVSPRFWPKVVVESDGVRYELRRTLVAELSWVFCSRWSR